LPSAPFSAAVAVCACDGIVAAASSTELSAKSRNEVRIEVHPLAIDFGYRSQLIPVHHLWIGGELPVTAGGRAVPAPS
jgi:hypothetical protein